MQKKPTKFELYKKQEKAVSQAISNLEENKAHSISAKLILEKQISEEERTFLENFLNKRDILLSNWNKRKLQNFSDIIIN